MDQLLPKDVLKLIPVKYYLIDTESKKVVQTNDDTLIDHDIVCYENIYGKNNPCKFKSGECICEHLLRDGKAEFVTKVKHDKQTKYVKTEASKLDNKFILETVTDVTDNELLKKDLKINNKKLARSEIMADIGYWEFNMNDKTVLASTGARKIYGLQPNELLTIPEVQKCPLPEYRSILDESLRALIEESKPYNVKFEIKRKSDGEIRQLRSIAEYRKDKNMVFGVLQDITENEKAQKALVENKNNLQLLFQNMNSGFAFHKIVTDNKGNPIDYIFLDVNEKFEKITGLQKDEIVGKKVSEVLPETEVFWIIRYGKVALTGEPVNFTDYSREFDKYFEVSAYSPKKDFFAVTITDVTYRIKSKKALDESLKNLKLAQQIAKLGHWQFNPDKKLTEWSEEVFKIIERDQALPVFSQQEYLSFFGKQKYAEFRKFLLKALKEGVPFQFQVLANVPKSKAKWIEIICKPDNKQSDSGYFLRGTIQDIDDKKQIEVQLDHSNKILRTVIDNVPDAVYMKDEKFRKLLANKVDAKRNNMDINDMIGKTDYEIYPKEIAEKYMEDDRKVIETGNPVINRQEIIPDGDTYRWVLTSKLPVKNAENKVIGLVGIGRDITEIKENESRLKLLQQVIEQSPLSVVITNTDGKIEYVNPCFEKTTGYSREEAIGKNPRILNSGHQKKSYYKKLWSTILAGENWVGEFHNKRKDGTTYSESTIIAPIYDENSKLTKFVAIKEDVTNIKKMVKDLEIAKEKAEESNRLKTVFLANMSHEIRTPLNGILGFSNIICSGMCTEEQLEKYGKIIENSGQRLITVIDDIIDISMIQANQMKVDFEEFDLVYLLEEIFVVYKNQKEKNLENIQFDLKLHFTNGDSNIFSDKNRIYQIFKNLLDNAFKFTDSGFIKFGCYKSDDTKIVLFVEDSGIGIEDDKIDMIFEIFRQVEEGSSRKYEGSGLGLAIISGIIEKLGGKIEVRSKIKNGTTFYVTLPRNLKLQPLNL